MDLGDRFKGLLGELGMGDGMEVMREREGMGWGFSRGCIVWRCACL